MPEPVDKDEPNPFSIDNENSYETEGFTKATHMDKFAFLLIPVGVSYSLGGVFLMRYQQQQDTKNLKFFNSYHYMICQGDLKIWWIITSAAAMPLGGACPTAYALRYIAIATSGWTGMIGHFFTHLCDHVYHGSQHRKAVEFFAARDSILIASMLQGLCYCYNQFKPQNKFAVRSAWGVYCCASYSRGRTLRSFNMYFAVVSLDFFVGDVLGQLGSMGDRPETPVLTYAWKRFKYLFQCLFGLDDLPKKHMSLFVTLVMYLLLANSSLSVAMISSASWADVCNYLAVDWLQFGLRLILLSRTGFQTCPKLLTFLLTKQLENVVIPLPVFAASQGDKTAMRVNQALLCLLEGETLSICFILLLIYIIQWWFIIRDYSILFICPMTNYGVAFIFALADCIQDILASKTCEKFSNWGYCYDRKNGLNAKIRHFYAFIGIYFTWGCVIGFWGGNIKKKWQAMESGVMSDNITQFQWFFGEASLFHL